MQAPVRGGSDRVPHQRVAGWVGRGSQILHKSQTQHMVTVEKEREVKDVNQVSSLETEKIELSFT